MGSHHVEAQGMECVIYVTLDARGACRDLDALTKCEVVRPYLSLNEAAEQHRALQAAGSIASGKGGRTAC